MRSSGGRPFVNGSRAACFLAGRVLGERGGDGASATGGRFWCTPDMGMNLWGEGPL